MKIGKLDIEKGVLLAPMEDVSNLPFRIICKKLGADIVYSEFIASEAIIRDVQRSFDKMRILEEERPVAIQIFGHNEANMVESAKRVAEMKPDIIDINFGCWVKKVVQRNAGAALLKEPEKMADMTRQVAEAVDIPVTVKTRLGWSKDDIVILKVAPMLEEAGAKALAIHCRTRDQGMGGEVQWEYIKEIKKLVNIPVILNGDVKTPEDAKRAFEETGCDAVMIGRAAIGNPFIFRKMRGYLDTGIMPDEPSVEEKISVCIEHLENNVKYIGYPRGLLEFRKHYSGYLKGMYNVSMVKQKLVISDSIDEIKFLLDEYYQYLKNEDRLESLDPKDDPDSEFQASCEI